MVEVIFEHTKNRIIDGNIGAIIEEIHSVFVANVANLILIKNIREILKYLSHMSSYYLDITEHSICFRCVFAAKEEEILFDDFHKANSYSCPLRFNHIDLTEMPGISFVKSTFGVNLHPALFSRRIKPSKKPFFFLEVYSGFHLCTNSCSMTITLTITFNIGFHYIYI